MVVRDRVQRHEQTHVVLVRHEVAVPRHHVKRRVSQGRLVQTAHELGYQLEVAVLLLKARIRRQEVARVRQAARDADGPQVRHDEEVPEVLEEVAPRGLVAAAQVDLEGRAPLDEHELERSHRHVAELRADLELALLRQDQHVRVGVAHEAPTGGHRAAAGIRVGGDAVLRSRGATGGRQGHGAVGEVHAGCGIRHGLKAELHRRARVREGRVHPRRVRPGHVIGAGGRRVQHRGSDPIQPGVAVLGARDREGSPRQHLRVEAVGRLLRGVRLPGQGPGQRLGVEEAAKGAMLQLPALRLAG
mmetsp:Transcript_38880/g.102753  ORF Transcript_38880/g.102753 Transcript_38880/m.102753 type:complete len:302 (+) Transcript_38880:636-1541(+)